MKMINQFPGRCYECGGQVRIGQGIADNTTGKWLLSHREGQCEVVLSTHASGEFGLATNIGGYEFKPDAEPGKPDARCYRCGTVHGVAWIAGAGLHLCYRHQDEY